MSHLARNPGNISRSRLLSLSSAVRITKSISAFSVLGITVEFSKIEDSARFAGLLFRLWQALGIIQTGFEKLVVEMKF